MDKFDLVSARRYIVLLNENKHHLWSNARALLDLLLNKTDSPLNRREMDVIHSLNTSAARFDIKGLKVTVENNADLLMKEKMDHYLNADAKILLEGINVIQREEYYIS